MGNKIETDLSNISISSAMGLTVVIINVDQELAILDLI